MIVDVTVAITRPDEVDEETVLSVLPHGKGKLTVIEGGMEIEGREGSGDFTLIANAAIIVRVRCLTNVVIGALACIPHVGLAVACVNRNEVRCRRRTWGCRHSCRRRCCRG